MKGEFALLLQTVARFSRKSVHTRTLRKNDFPFKLGESQKPALDRVDNAVQ